MFTIAKFCDKTGDGKNKQHDSFFLEFLSSVQAMCDVFDKYPLKALRKMKSLSYLGLQRFFLEGISKIKS